MHVETPEVDQTERCLELARAGDKQAFGELIAPYSRELHVHCYRMLGSVIDAEDLLQETLLAAWRGLDAFAGRAPLRAWLYRIATNRCLNAIRGSRRRGPPEPLPPFDPPAPSRLGEVPWLQPYPDAWLSQAQDAAPGPAARYLARETIELAFIAALQRLPPRQTAALLLTDVLGFSLAEVAAMLDTSATAVKGVLQRARASLGQQACAGSERIAAPAERELARRFARAFTDDDIPGVIALLTDDAWLAMPPAPHEYLCRQAIAAFLQASATWRAGRQFVLEPTRANSQPGFVCSLTDPLGAPAATGVIVLTVTTDGIRTITRFLDSDLDRFFRTAPSQRAPGKPASRPR